MIRAAVLLAAWVALCVAALSDAGIPYQCGTDTECEMLHGPDPMLHLEEDDPFSEGLTT